MKSLPFHIPKAWKRFPFRTEPPHIGHYYGEYFSARRKCKRKSKCKCKQRSHVQRKDNEGVFFSLSCASMEPMEPVLLPFLCTFVCVSSVFTCAKCNDKGKCKKWCFSHFVFVGNWACVCICVTHQCSSHVYFLGFTFVNCIWVKVVNQTLN